MTDLSHSGSLRGAEFRKLMGKWKTWAWVALPSIAIGLALGFGLGGALTLSVLFAAILILIGIGIVLLVAHVRSANAFYRSYAEARGLTWHQGGAPLEGTCAFLRKGDRRMVNQSFSGPLAEGIEGNLALYTYTEESTDSEGNSRDHNYPFTVVTVNMPEVATHMKDLAVHTKSGLKSLEKLEDAFRRKHERVTLESEALRDRYEIFVGKEQDPVWTRRLFSPSFIVWLTETPPKKFAFELEDGYFVAYIPKHRNSAALLDEMLEISCYAARRIRDEATDTIAVGEAPTAGV